MKTWLLGMVAMGSLGAVAPAVAQNNDTIVVTAQRIMSDDEYSDEYGELPYVSLVARADFVLFTVNLESATNSAAERKTELDRAYRALVQRVARAQGVRMQIGSPGNSIRVETATAEEVTIDGGRRSWIPVILEFDVGPNETFQQVRTRAEAFIKGIEVNGRVEATTGSEQFVGLREPAKHRADLLRKIAEDTRLMQDIFVQTSSLPGYLPGISLTGLGGRVKTRPIGPLEIELYIPYSVVLGAPLPQPPPR